MRYASYKHTGEPLAEGDLLSHVRGRTPRVIIDYKVGRFALQVEPGKKLTWFGGPLFRRVVEAVKLPLEDILDRFERMQK